MVNAPAYEHSGFAFDRIEKTRYKFGCNAICVNINISMCYSGRQITCEGVSKRCISMCIPREYAISLLKIMNINDTMQYEVKRVCNEN